ncbi:hypothetical protein P7K49_010473 [Saguinus oedipus]|uniref:HMG box domain-containing protein n=1 Tax=Saguinus oedipus TaxID=9490 RepID=A0ABQ9VND4_SAGOE|nr:hypothetical protein P7K49_010473 [Saguinus oedipus]
MLTLLECMKNNLPSNDSSKFKTTESHMDWEKVAFKDFSGDMCKLKWVEISNEVRKFRTLTELILDAQEHVKNPYKGKKLKKHPDFPKKPLTPYFRFFMEKRAKYAKLHPEMSNLDLTKILSKKYKELPEKKKAAKRWRSLQIGHEKDGMGREDPRKRRWTRRQPGIDGEWQEEKQEAHLLGKETKSYTASSQKVTLVATTL